MGFNPNRTSISGRARTSASSKANCQKVELLMLLGTRASGGGGLLAKRKHCEGCGISRKLPKLAKRFAAVSVLGGFYRLFLMLIFIHVLFQYNGSRYLALAAAESSYGETAKGEGSWNGLARFRCAYDRR